MKICSIELQLCETYLALSYVRNGETSEAHIWCDRAMNRFEDRDNDTWRYAAIVKSLAFINAGMNQRLLDFSLKHEVYFGETASPLLRGMYSANLGLALKNSGRTIEAIDCFENSRAFHQ